eukprot:snap_masked-scaffold_4-processed-gene-5.59-mRNA-1 protein AED:1.00 eAED:1.00 QI:0/0/0/0/1/1/2/0/65
MNEGNEAIYKGLVRYVGSAVSQFLVNPEKRYKLTYPIIAYADNKLRSDFCNKRKGATLGVEVRKI